MIGRKYRYTLKSPIIKYIKVSLFNVSEQDELLLRTTLDYISQRRIYKLGFGRPDTRFIKRQNSLWYNSSNIKNPYNSYMSTPLSKKNRSFLKPHLKRATLLGSASKLNTYRKIET